MKALHKVVRYLFFLLTLALLSKDIKAQTTGCLVGGIVYSTTPKAGNYDASGTKTSLASGYCSWTPSTGVSCIVCFPDLNPGGNCAGMGRSSQAGIENTFTMVLCPLDIHVDVMVILMVFVGYVLIHINTYTIIFKNLEYYIISFFVG